MRVKHIKFFPKHGFTPREKLSVLGENNEYAKGAIKGANEKFRQQRPIVDPLIAAHIQYGNNMIQILNFLENNSSEWSYKNDELLIYDDNLLNEYNKLVEELGKNEYLINDLSEELIKML